MKAGRQADCLVVYASSLFVLLHPAGASSEAGAGNAQQHSRIA